MKVLLLLSLLLLVCYSHTKLRTNSPSDQPQLDLQLSEIDNEIKLIGHSQSLDVPGSLNIPVINNTLYTGLAKVYDQVKANRDLQDGIVWNTPVVISIHSKTKNGVLEYTFVVNQDDAAGRNTLRSVFTIASGGTSLSYINYIAQNVSVSSTSPESYKSENVNLVDPTAAPATGESLLQKAYRTGFTNVNKIALSRGDIPPGVNFDNNYVVSILSQKVGRETNYLFNIHSNTRGLDVILYSSFTINQNGTDLTFTDFAYNVQKNQFGRALPQAVVPLPEGAENNITDPGQAYQLGLRALERIAKADGHLATTDTFSVWKVNTIHRQDVGRGTDYSYTFQANVNSTGGVVFATTFVVTKINGTFALASYAYNELQQVSYSAIPDNMVPRNISDINNDVLAFGIQALIQVAADLGHVRANFVSSVVEVAQYYSQRNNNDDNTFVFVFNTTDNRTKVVIAASISVVVRGTQRILSGYAYNILSANSTTVVSSALETLDYNAVKSNADVNASLTTGLESLRLAAIQKGDLGRGAVFLDVKVNSTLQKSTIGFDYTYIFRVEIHTNGDATLGAVLSVTWRAVNTTRYLSAYAYNIQNFTRNYAKPESLINFNVQLASNHPLYRFYRDFGIGAVIAIAINKTDLPVGFTALGEPVVTSFQTQITGSDVAYLFQVTITGAPNITVALGYTVVIRTSGGNATILTAYAYTVQTTRLTQVLAQPAVEVVDVPGKLVTSQSLRDAVAYGLEQLFLIAVNRRDLKTADTFNQASRSIEGNRVLNQTTGNDFAYIFNVSINTVTGLRVSASLSVTIRVTSSRPVLSGYAYIVQNSTLTRVNPTPFVDQPVAITNTVNVGALLDYGVAELIRIARQAGNLPPAFPGGPTVEVTRVQSSTTGSDVTYVFDFNVENAATKIRLASVISVTLRAVSPGQVLNYYVYSVLYTNTSSLLPQAYQKANVNLADTGVGKQLLDFGLSEVVQILKNAGVDTSQFQSNRTKVVNVETQTVDGDTSYSFQVMVNNERGLILGAAITATRRTFPNSLILVNYAYNLQNTTGRAVGTRYSRYLNSTEVTNQDVVDYLSAGADFITAAAKAKNYIRNDVTFGPANAISAQELLIGNSARGYQFQANLNDRDGVTISATFTVLQIGSNPAKVVSNYQYNVQTVTRGNARS